MLMAEPLTAAAFKPYGEVLAAPPQGGRAYFDGGLENARGQARASLSMIRLAPLEGLSMQARVLERHAYSSQSFVPLSVSRWLVIVAPPAAAGGPDARRAQAFVAGPGQAITLLAGTWHHGLTVLDREAQFSIFMWRDGSPGDEELVTLDQPFGIAVPPDTTATQAPTHSQGGYT